MNLSKSLTATLCLPLHVSQTVRVFEQELERKEGMIADLNQLAEDNHGLDPEDCNAIVRHVRDRDDLRTALDCIGRIFS